VKIEPGNLPQGNDLKRQMKIGWVLGTIFEPGSCRRLPDVRSEV